jgi:hypothetical protein
MSYLIPSVQNLEILEKLAVFPSAQVQGGNLGK